MPDIKRNDGKVKRTDVKEIKLEKSVDVSNKVQVIQGNTDLIVIKMLEAVNKNLASIQNLLIQIRDK